MYDSAGRNVRHLPNDGEYELDRVYDGDGLEVKKIEKVWDFENNQWKEPTRKYYIRSTVKSGEIITEVAGDGKKSQTFVYAGSDLLARQTLSNDAVPVESVKWEHWDPAKISRRTTDKDRNSPSFSGVELDPLNKNALYFCLPQQPERGQYLLNSHDFPGAWAASAMQFCNFGGLFGPCDVVEGLGGNYFPFYGRSNDRFAQLPFEIAPRQIRNLDHPMAVAYDTFHELYSGAFLEMSGYNYAEGSSNNFVSSIYGYGMSDLHRLLGQQAIKKLPKSLADRKQKLTDKELADLKSEFGDALGIKNGDDSCEDKLNELLEALGSKTTSVKDLADSFFGGRNKLYGVSENVTTIRVKLNGKWTAVGAPAGETGWNGSRFEAVINNKNPNITTLSTFVHEIFHAAGNHSTYDHPSLNEAVRRVIGDDDLEWNLDRFFRKYCTKEGYKE